MKEYIKLGFGFAIGMARLIAKLLGLPNIKESTFIFRGPHNILP